jgi:hypothetical protein
MGVIDLDLLSMPTEIRLLIFGVIAGFLLGRLAYELVPRFARLPGDHQNQQEVLMLHARTDYARIQDPSGLIPADEPVLLLRARDVLAPDMLLVYVDKLKRVGAERHMIKAVEDHYRRMILWQTRCGCKIPDMPPPEALDEGVATA